VNSRQARKRFGSDQVGRANVLLRSQGEHDHNRSITELGSAKHHKLRHESSAARIRNRTVGERAGEHAAEATNLLNRINDPVSPLRIQGRSLV
jgi:hypothetical protein